MMARRFHSLLLLLALLPLLASAEDDECVYTVYVRTGTPIKGGTDATIGVSLGDASGLDFQVKDLVSWGGLMGPDHDYFERGNLDIFSGRGPCGLSTPLCRLNVTSDGSGKHPGWYLDYVEVTFTGPHLNCSQTLFNVYRWLATDAWPFQLTATINVCDQARAPRNPNLVLGNRLDTDI
uniref:PLAT domain-containing protein 3 n=1 Tax=Elaeis guineensis var. tenera TaxID=51953 RepID=A0A6I9R325_ELAGV|nr:PLAT domain-containing protein 3 [Elaeis guineensis]